jgi:hypothetical protein
VAMSLSAALQGKEAPLPSAFLEKILLVNPTLVFVRTLPNGNLQAIFRLSCWITITL